MNSLCSVEDSDGITTIRLKESLNLESALEVIDFVGQWKPSNRQLWVATEKFSVTAIEAEEIAARDRLQWPVRSRVAYVAADDLSFGILRMLEVFRMEDNCQTQVFRDEKIALAWLKEWDGCA